MEKRKSMNQVSAEMNIKKSQLACWESEFNIPIPKNQMGYRYYLSAHVQLMKAIKIYQRRGKTRSDIQKMVQKQIDKIAKNQVVERELVECQKERLIHYLNWYEILMDRDSVFNEGFKKFIANIEAIKEVEQPKILRILNASDFLEKSYADTEETQKLMDFVAGRMEGYRPDKVWLQSYSFKENVKTLENEAVCNRWLVIAKNENFIRALREMPNYKRYIEEGRLLLGKINEKNGFLEIISDENNGSQSKMPEIEYGDTVQIPNFGECHVKERIEQKEDFLNHFEVDFEGWTAAVIKPQYEMQVLMKENKQVGFLYRKQQK